MSAEPGWKRNGRNGPLDWWLSCKDHGYDYCRGCMSCDIVEDHNIQFQLKLDAERHPAAEYYGYFTRDDGEVLGAAGYFCDTHKTNGARFPCCGLSMPRWETVKP
jgi:hypothetical protein